jgi:LPS-assembly lipoprotein
MASDRFPPQPIGRRRLLIAGTSAALLAGCGFELRRAPTLPFGTIALAGFKPASPMAEALRNAIAGSATTRVVEGVALAQVVLTATADAHERSVVVSTSAGQVREIQVRARLRFSLTTSGGKELIPETEMLLVRDLTYNERNALAKEQEEDALYRTMSADIAMQVLRRLAAVRSLV